MLDFFRTLVGRGGIDPRMYATIEEVVDIADPTIRRARKYKKKLVSPIETAQSFCLSFMDVVPGPVRLDRDAYFHDPRVKALFATPEQMEDLLRFSPDMGAMEEERSGSGRALLTMTKEEKTTFGHQKTGEMIMRDVAQRTVNFTDHRLVAPSHSAGGVQDGVVGRGVEVLATVAMEHITNLRTTISELRQKRDYLQGAKKILQGRSRIQSSFSVPDPDKQSQLEKAIENLEIVEDELQDALKELSYPEDSLHHLVDILENPAQMLVAEPYSIQLNWMNVILDGAGQDGGTEIELVEFSVLDEFKRYGVWVEFDFVK